MAGIVYILCALTSLLCTLLLVRAYLNTRSKLLFWCCFGFLGFALNNALLFIDMVLFPDVTFIIQYRALPSVLGMMVMVYGLVMEEI